LKKLTDFDWRVDVVELGCVLRGGDFVQRPQLDLVAVGAAVDVDEGHEDGVDARQIGLLEAGRRGPQAPGGQAPEGGEQRDQQPPHHAREETVIARRWTRHLFKP